MGPTGRYHLHDAFLLHRRSFRETSLLIDIFSPGHGILRLIAKGALRGKGSRGGVLQPFLPLSVAWSSRGDPPVLTVADAADRLIELSGKNLFCGFYLNELLIRLLPLQDPQPRIFAFYRLSLQRLETGVRVEETLRFFELGLLEELGYGLMLESDAESGAEIRPDRHYAYRIEHGPVECAASDHAIRGSVLLGLRDGVLMGPQDASEAKRLMRRVINHYLGGKPLRSRALFKFSAFSPEP